MEKKSSKISELKRDITLAIRDYESQMPLYFIFKEEGDPRQFKITLELIEPDFFIDSRGIKWMRVRND